MCKPASFILTKDKCFWSRFTDSHEDIIAEFKLHADGAKGPNIMRVEVTPPDGDMSRPAAEWIFNVDQDILPKWWDAEDGEKRARIALDEWIAANVISEGRQKRKEGRVFVVGRATVTAGDNTTVMAGDNTTVTAWDNTTVKAWDNATVNAWDNATVTAGDNTTVMAGDNTTVTAWDNTTVTAGDNTTVMAGDNTTVTAWDNTTVTASRKTTVIRWSVNAAVMLEDDAVLVDRSSETVKCYVAGDKF